MADSTPLSEASQDIQGRQPEQNPEPDFQHGRQGIRRVPINVGEAERYGSIASGVALMLAGLVRRGVGGLILGGLGAAFIQRGVTGHCALYERLGVSGARPQRHGVPGNIGIKVERSISINRPVPEVFRFLRDSRNLPRFMKHLERVEIIGAKRSHWVAKAFNGRRLEWDVEIINEHPNELIAWESTAGARVPNAGAIRLKPTPDGRNTEVRITLEVYPPAGMLGIFGAKLFGVTPEQEVEEDLAMLKRVSDAGEAGSSEGESAG